MKWLLIFLFLFLACGSKKVGNHFVSPSPAPPEVLVLNFPDKDDWDRWHKFTAEHTTLANIPELRKSELPSDDIEVRVWFSVSFTPTQCVILKRVHNIWFGMYLKGDTDYHPTKVTISKLPRPLSDWQGAWNKLQTQGILNFPEVVGEPIIDGSGYMVEVLRGKSYKASMIMNPEYAKHKAGEQMIEISNILSQEFDLPGFFR